MEDVVDECGCSGGRIYLVCGIVIRCKYVFIFQFLEELSMNKCKKWLATFGIVILLGLAAVAGLTIYVDPFFQYHKPLAWFP